MWTLWICVAIAGHPSEVFCKEDSYRNPKYELCRVEGVKRVKKQELAFQAKEPMSFECRRGK